MDAPPDIYTKLPAAVAGGSPPNVAGQGRFTIAASAAQGLWQDIAAPANQAGIKAADYEPGFWEDVLIKGKLYGLPYSTDTRMIYMNVAQLRQAGIATTAPKTLEEFTQIGQQLTVKQGASFQRIGFYPWNDNWGPYGWGWLFGGSFFDAANNKATVDDPKIVAAFDWAGSVAKQLGYQAVQDFFKASKGNAYNGNMFIAQQQSSYINANTLIAALDKAGPSLDWTVWAPPPPQGVAHTATWSGGFCTVLPAGARNPDQSFALMGYLSDADFQRLEIKAGLLPTLKVVAADPYWQTVDPRVKAFVDLLQYTNGQPASPQSNIMNDELNKAFTTVISGQQTAAQALKATNDLINSAIQQNRTDLYH